MQEAIVVAVQLLAAAATTGRVYFKPEQPSRLFLGATWRVRVDP